MLTGEDSPSGIGNTCCSLISLLDLESLSQHTQQIFSSHKVRVRLVSIRFDYSAGQLQVGVVLCSQSSYFGLNRKTAVDYFPVSDASIMSGTSNVVRALTNLKYNILRMGMNGARCRSRNRDCVLLAIVGSRRVIPTTPRTRVCVCQCSCIDTSSD